MWTRGVLRRTWGVHDSGITVHSPAAWQQGEIVRTGPIPLKLPPLTVAMDPSDPTTWRRPVRVT